MKALSLILPIVLVSSFPASCQERAAESPQVVVTDQVVGSKDDVEAIRTTADRLIEAIFDEDLDELMTGFTDDIVIIPPNHPVLKGKAAARTFYSEQFRGYDLEEFGPTLEELVVSGDWAFTRGTSLVVAVSQENRDRHRVFKRGMEVWKKGEDGLWRIARAIGNS